MDPVVKAEKPAPAKSFTLVMASYVSQKGAAELNSRLAKMGLTEGDVYTYRHVTRAIYGSYSTEDEARSALKELRRQSSDFAEAWVLEKK